VKLPEHNSSFTDVGQITDMAVYFARPPELYHLTYTNFNKNYRHVTSPGGNSQQIFIPGVTKSVYLKERSDNHNILVRMEMLYPSAGEIWYLRIILLNRPCASYVDALTFHGHVCKTFQHSAIAHGYVSDNSETLLCFQEATLMSTPTELHFLFATLTMQGFPTLQIYQDQTCYEAMTLDYRHDARVVQSKEGIENALLIALHQLFVEHHCRLGDFSLPEPKEYPTELAREKLKYNAEEQGLLLQQLNQRTPNNHEQEEIFQEIVESINSNETMKYFIQGQGGCGKTTLAKKILAYTRSKGLIALGCASTGLAATIYQDFYTAHDLFCYPVIEAEVEDESEPARCDFERHQERFELICAAKVIIWDEMISNHKEIYEAAYQATDCFKGKIIIGMGDWRQTLPIVKSGVTEEIIAACLKNSYRWREFKVVKLTINMRLNEIQNSINSKIRQLGNLYRTSNEYQNDQEELTSQNR
jgi:GTPase SAR1 family protein